jgi:hypothetical protein
VIAWDKLLAATDMGSAINRTNPWLKLQLQHPPGNYKCYDHSWEDAGRLDQTAILGFCFMRKTQDLKH